MPYLTIYLFIVLVQVEHLDGHQGADRQQRRDAADPSLPLSLASLRRSSIWTGTRCR